MHVFVAGGSGAIGRPLVRALVAVGHRVTALTRSPHARADLGALGAEVAVADALDRDALVEAVASARPTHVVHQLTALPKAGPRRDDDLAATNRLRIDGTRNLLEAAIGSGSRRFIVGSFAMLADGRTSEGLPGSEAADAVRSMEHQVLDETRRGAIEGAVLRYGMFYGPDVPSTVALIDMVRKRRLPVVRSDAGQLPLIHVDDAVAATVAALERAPAGAVYDVVDDRPVSFTEIVETLAEYTGSPAPLRVPVWLLRLVAPYMARMTAMRMPLSNARTAIELGWRPTHPTLREGLARALHRAA